MNRASASRTDAAAASLSSPIDHWMAQRPDSGAVVRRGYVICSTPRTGSYYLCDLLRSTGLLGRPHEFFGGLAMRRLGSPDYPLDLAGQIAAALEDGSTTNGIFGVKLFADQFARHDREIFAGLGDPMLVYLEREDLLGQAISLTRAAQTKVFFAGAGSAAAPPFDAALIRDYLELILHWNAAWELYFARCGIAPLRLSYEQVVASPQESVDLIAAALDLDQAATICPERLSLSIQRDAVNDEWRERFLAAQNSEFNNETLRSKAAITSQRRLRRLARMLRLRND